MYSLYRTPSFILAAILDTSVGYHAPFFWVFLATFLPNFMIIAWLEQLLLWNLYQKNLNWQPSWILAAILDLSLVSWYPVYLHGICNMCAKFHVCFIIWKIVSLICYTISVHSECTLFARCTRQTPRTEFVYKGVANGVEWNQWHHSLVCMLVNCCVFLCNRTLFILPWFQSALLCTEFEKKCTLLENGRQS